MMVSLQSQVRPDLIGDDVHIVLLVQRHGPLQLPSLPHSAAGIVGAAEDGGVDMLVPELALHVVKIHPPDAVPIDEKGRGNDLIAVVFQCLGEAGVSGAVQQHLVALGAEDVQGAGDSAQDTVGIADLLRLQPLDPVSPALPGDDPVKIFLPGVEVSESGMLRPAHNGIGDDRHHWEVHIRHPHGDHVEALLRLCRWVVHRQSIHSPAVHYGGKIILHDRIPPAYLICVHYTAPAGLFQQEFTKFPSRQ